MDKKGFTLAELLITLTVVGIVAAITIPNLISQYQERALATASDVFQKRLTIALKTMVTQNAMNGYSSTEDFVLNGLSNEMKVIKTCKLDKLYECFSEEFQYGTEQLELSDLKEAWNFDKEDWTTTPYGVVFADGTSAIMLYNDKCPYIDPYNNQADATACISMAYDVNGLKSPNSLNKDLYTINATLSKSACIAPGLKKATGVCITKSVSVSNDSRSYDECLKLKDKYGLKYCYKYNCGIAGVDCGDPYAAAVMECGGLNKVASPDQMRRIAQYVYGTENINADKSTYGLTVVQEHWDEVFAGAVVPTSGAYYYLTNDERATSALERNFSNGVTQVTTHSRGWCKRAICVR